MRRRAVHERGFPGRAARRQRPSGAAILSVARKAGLFVLLAAMIVGFWLAEPAFLNVNNLFSVLQAVAVVAILGVGVTLTLAVDGFDLSIGSIAASAVMAASYAMVVWQFNAYETIPAGAGHGRHDRPGERPAHRAGRHSRPARHAVVDVPARRPAADPDRRPLDHIGHDHAKRRDRTRRLRPGLLPARPGAGCGMSCRCRWSSWPSSRSSSGSSWSARAGAASSTRSAATRRRRIWPARRPAATGLPPMCCRARWPRSAG